MSAALTEQIFAEIIAESGGRLYRVGGCVRDAFMGVTPKDIDFCVVGMVKKNFKALFPDAEEYGKSFPVFQLLVDGRKCEVAFARTERKVGSGYKGFKVASNPKVTIEEDLFRRDTTVNSMAVDSLSGKIIDPFNGRQDLQARILRATSKHFSDDPMRALRLAGQSARLGFQIDGETLLLASAVGAELTDEPVERTLSELTKVLTEAKEPSRFFKVLTAAKLLQITFPELAALSEADLRTAMDRLDAVAEAVQDPALRFAVLGFSLDQAGMSLWNRRMTLPGEWLNSAITAGTVMKLLKKPTSSEAIADAINILRRGSLRVEEFDVISQAAGLGIPALQPLKTAMADIVVPKDLKGREISEWLRQRQVEAITNMLQ